MGGKRVKLALAHPVYEPIEDVYGAAGGLLQEQLALLRAMNGGAAAAAAKKGGITPAVLRETAGIARAISLLAAEIRQREKHAHRAFDRLTVEERFEALCSTVRELSAPERDRLRALLDELAVGVLG